MKFTGLVVNVMLLGEGDDHFTEKDTLAYQINFIHRVSLSFLMRVNLTCLF